MFRPLVLLHRVCRRVQADCARAASRSNFQGVHKGGVLRHRVAKRDVLPCPVLPSGSPPPLLVGDVSDLHHAAQRDEERQELAVSPSESSSSCALLLCRVLSSRAVYVPTIVRRAILALRVRCWVPNSLHCYPCRVLQCRLANSTGRWPQTRHRMSCSSNSS